MKATLLIALQFGPYILSAQATEVRNVPLDFNVASLQLKRSEMAYGWKLMPWTEWLNRPTSGPLMIPISHSKRDIEVFEAHMAGLSAHPVSRFTKAYLHNIGTLKKLDPSNQYRQVPDPEFVVETVVPFPNRWSDLITIGRKTKLLSPKNVDYLRMVSAFGYADRRQIQGDGFSDILKSLEPTLGLPDAINFQGTLKVNQIALFISNVTLFYGRPDNSTLVVSHLAMGIKKHILDLGFEISGLNLTGRGVLLGQNKALNTPGGIGAGLPKYTESFFKGVLERL